MGLPEGHVTGHGLTRTAELKMLGNGVVPQQAALALRLLLGLPAAAPQPFDGPMIGTPQAGLGEGGGKRSPRFRGNAAPTPQELIEELAHLAVADA